MSLVSELNLWCHFLIVSVRILGYSYRPWTAHAVHIPIRLDAGYFQRARPDRTGKQLIHTPRYYVINLLAVFSRFKIL